MTNKNINFVADGELMQKINGLVHLLGSRSAALRLLIDIGYWVFMKYRNELIFDAIEKRNSADNAVESVLNLHSFIEKQKRKKTSMDVI